MIFVLNLIIFTVFTEDVATGLENITVQTADDCNLGDKEEKRRQNEKWQGIHEKTKKILVNKQNYLKPPRRNSAKTDQM